MATKKSELSKDKIVSMYMDYVLEHNEKPKSVFKFSKINNITEKEFYGFFGTIESIEKEIFNMFYEKTSFNNVYNRLILYDSETWHKESSFIINSQNARLTQVFFIDLVESYSFPIQRKNQFNI